MLYTVYETQRRMMEPLALLLNHNLNTIEKIETFLPKSMLANMIQAPAELIYQFTRKYPKPQFNLESVLVNGKDEKVEQIIVSEKPFCNLINFKKKTKQPPLLIVAPLSGHYATLLRDTVKSSLSEFDVYITDWKNVCDIPLEEGDFGFDDYVQYVIDDIKHIKQKHGSCNVMAVCQPTIPVLTATAWLEKNNSDFCPDSLVLMGGPVDVRNSPTEVNKYALKHDIEWFKRNVINTVPFYFAGAGRRVYPGFLQHMGFVSMNFIKHTQAQMDFFNDLLIGSDLDAKKHKDFYQEYNAVMDLPSKYYLETLEKVFIDQHLAKDKMTFKGEKISLSDVKKTRLLTIEGELDDISGSGQTHSASTLCKNLKASNKKSLTIEKVGHYGIFAGKTWRNVIFPQVAQFVKK